MWTIVSDWVARSVLVWRHMDYCFKLGGSECASVATYRHVDYCFRLGGSECASVATCGLLFQTGVARSVLVWRHVDYMWTIVSDWVAQSVLVWRHVDYCFRWVARSVLVWRHVDYCFRLGGSECASVATCGLLFQTGWLGVC